MALLQLVCGLCRAWVAVRCRVGRCVTTRSRSTPTSIRRPASGIRWVGNLGGWACTGIAYRHNVGVTCGGTGKQVAPSGLVRAAGTAPLGWINPAPHDFHLAAGSPAIDAADPDDHPATDRDGRSRGSAPDAGAYER